MTSVTLDMVSVISPDDKFIDKVKSAGFNAKEIESNLVYTALVKNISYFSLLKILETGVIYCKIKDVDTTSVETFNSELLMRLKQKSNNSIRSLEGLKLILTDLFYVRNDSDAVYGDYDQILNALMHDLANIKYLIPIYTKTDAVIIATEKQLETLSKIKDNDEISDLVNKMLTHAEV